MRKFWMLGVVSMLVGSGCAALIGLRDEYTADDASDAAGVDARLDDVAITPDSGPITDGSVTDADAGPSRFCERAARDGSAPLFCADFDEGEAGAGFESIFVLGDAGFSLVTTPNESPPRSLMIGLPASLDDQIVTLKKDVALPMSRATVSFVWRVESVAEAPNTNVAEIRTTSPDLTLGVGLTFNAGKARFCNATPVDIVPGVWHKAEATVISGAISCEMDGTSSVTSTNGVVSIVGISLGSQRFPAPIDASVMPAVRVFFDNVLIIEP